MRLSCIIGLANIVFLAGLVHGDHTICEPSCGCLGGGSEKCASGVLGGTPTCSVDSECPEAVWSLTGYFQDCVPCVHTDEPTDVPTAAPTTAPVPTLPVPTGSPTFPSELSAQESDQSSKPLLTMESIAIIGGSVGAVVVLGIVLVAVHARRNRGKPPRAIPAEIVSGEHDETDYHSKDQIPECVEIARPVLMEEGRKGWFRKLFAKAAT